MNACLFHEDSYGKKTVMNILEQVFLWPRALISLNPRVELLGHRVGVCLTLPDTVVDLLKELIYCFHYFKSNTYA